jgi:uncharacterized RDD family membrane protein YckC
VKCPKCGFVSYPGLAQCKKCGYGFVRAPQKPSSPTSPSLIAKPGPGQEDKEKATNPPSANMDPDQSTATKEPRQDKGPPTKPDDIENEFVRDLREDVASTAKAPAAGESTPWRQELSERVQSFRQRRARLRNEPAPRDNLDFEFEPTEANALPGPGVEEILEFPQSVLSVDAEIGPRAALEDDVQHLDAETLEKGAEKFETLDSAPVLADEFAIEPASPASNRLEILVGPTEVDAQAAASQLRLHGLPVAPMGRRFLAGLADGLVLLLAVGLFAFIFWTAGGHLTPVPLNLAIVVLIATLFVLAYFGLFTALTFSTPGLIWMQIEVRNSEGWPPAPRESFLRAFGYLVSISALMIGFLWALVDSEGLTWHDRISGTFLTPVNQRATVEGEESSV